MAGSGLVAQYGSVAVGQANHVNHVTHYGGSYTPPTFPAEVGVIPRKPRQFIETESLTRLAVATYGFDKHETPYVALVGGLGTGKTCLAAHFARQFAESQDLVVWISAATREAVLDAYADACRYVVRPAPTDRDRAAERFLNWAESTKHSWVVVLDGVREPGDVRGLLPPRRAGGLTMVTTRRRDVPSPGPTWRQVEVGAFTKDERIDFLSAVAEEHDLASPGSVNWTLDDLGSVPMLVERVASCAVEKGRWPDVSRNSEPVQDVCARVWTPAVHEELTTAVNAALPDDRAARVMAKLLGMMPLDPFPVAVFTSDAVRRHLGGADPEEALSLLRTYSLLDGTDGAAIWPAPPLLGVAFGPRGEPDEATRVRVLADGLLESWPHSPADEVVTDSFTDSAKYVIALGLAIFVSRDHSDGDGDAIDVHPLVFPLIETLGNTGRRLNAARVARDCLSCFEDADSDRDRNFVSGPDPRTFLRLLRESLRWSGESGNVRVEVSELSELVAESTTTLGAGDLDVLITRSQLAHAMTKDRRPADAEQELAVLVPMLEGRVGPSGPERLIALGRFGIACSKARPDQPPAALESAVAEMAARLGRQHPVTAEFRIALALEVRARADGSAPTDDEVDTMREATAVLGRRHPRVVEAELRIAATGAHRLTAEALNGFRQPRQVLLGYGHPVGLIVAVAVARLAVDKAGDDATARSAAIAELAREIVVCAGTVGMDHPDVLDARATLAEYSGDAWSRALALATIHADWTRRYGAHHPDAKRADEARAAAVRAAWGSTGYGQSGR
ncbi:NB-ARC domain-containing protein [Yinghuangia soli]|uniref:NB-ARC domain-containing protein n=1 Tax=Yinghuangia soli TaxID=2908204 RepID=A0AA41Q3R7_9ACTN|nr:NB-ARC domain-containing protein [Yinghuangia soli]MCF2530989.1 NB-ARC domain-containing protein [Yinghuangia soli]